MRCSPNPFATFLNVNRNGPYAAPEIASSCATQIKIQKEHEREHFTEQGLQILTLLQEAEERLDQQPELRRQATLEELNQSTNQLGGIAGMVLSEQIEKTCNQKVRS